MPQVGFVPVIAGNSEFLQDCVTNYHKVRRLHLIVVDLRPWKYNTARAREITDQLWRISDCDATRRVSPFRPDGTSTQVPSICTWLYFGWLRVPVFSGVPQRDGQSYVLLDTIAADTLVFGTYWTHVQTCNVSRVQSATEWTASVYALDQSFFHPLGMQHFYDSLALVSQICVRRDALTLLGLNDDLLPDFDLHITGARVSVCKPHTLQWAESLKTRKISLGLSAATPEAELVPERWPLARLSFSSKMCWPSWPCCGWLLRGLCNTGGAQRIADFPSPRMPDHDAIYLAEKVAAILRAILHIPPKSSGVGTFVESWCFFISTRNFSSIQKVFF